MTELPQTPIVHLYRGELGRLTTYRVRLDTTTNWALGASVAVVTFTLGHEEAPPGLLLLPYLLSMVFAYMESRRFLDMEISRSRVRMLEQGFFAKLVSGDPPDAEFRAQLEHSLLVPRPTIGMLDALGNRVRRNYLWLFTTLYIAWGVKLWLVGPAAAALGPLPEMLVIGLSPLTVLPWAVLAATSHTKARRANAIEDHD